MSETPVLPVAEASSASEPVDFIRKAVADDLAAGRFAKVHTRFPPEPNGYLHIGHAKALCIDFGIAAEFGGLCNLRFDDTNPVKEDTEYVDAIMEDIRWLGFDWGDRLFYASDYFAQLYQYALQLIDKGLAYIDDLSAEQIREYRGTLTQPGRESPFRSRSAAENRELFEKMRAGEFPDGACVLRAKIDMASPNINLRDPVMYRILHSEHHRTGNAWCIYPMYDFAHGQSDSLEGITHSLCSLEYEIHRPLYDWFCEALGIYHPRQIEFARLNLSYTVMSKRKLLELVREGLVSGWDDPRLPTLCGLRRRGYTPEAIHDFCERIGVAKMDSLIDLALLEHCLREDLNRRALRRMAVLDPLRIVLTDYPEGKIEELECENNPEDPDAGTRKVMFCRELFIEREDFLENPPPKFFRLAPGVEIRLKNAYYIRCEEVVKDASGNIAFLRCSHDPASRGGGTAEGRKVKGTLHWVSASHAVPAEVRLYDRLFLAERPEDAAAGGAAETAPDADWKAGINPDSRIVRTAVLVEPALAEAAVGERFQFLRQGYFTVDPDSRPGRPVFNLSVRLKDSWEKIKGR